RCGGGGGGGGSLLWSNPRGSSVFSWLERRRRGLAGFALPGRAEFEATTRLYAALRPVRGGGGGGVGSSSSSHGAVFNLEYSPDGSVLAAACELCEVLLLDPLTSRPISTIAGAHEDCVNNIRFLDDRLFATCSDDTTVALWDLRCVRRRVSSLHGHSSWVKNVEYDRHSRLLATSGFDGNVLVWDTNRCTEEGCPHRTFFHTRYLMRMRLAPDCSRMLVSTSSGYLLTLHNLDLTRDTTRHGELTQTLTSSLARSLTSSDARSSLTSSFAHPLAHQLTRSPKRSPKRSHDRSPKGGAGGSCITSLQVHPQGRAALIRCSHNHDE
ncbi:unnamed protein product, partial [Lampetra fluviatilis]